MRHARITELVTRTGTAIVGDRIHRVRVGMGLSIRDVALRAGVSKTSVLRLEQGGSCRPATLATVCAVLGLHVERLAEGASVEPGAVHREGDDRWYDMADVAAGPLPRAGRQAKARVSPLSNVAVAVDLLRSRLQNGRILPTMLEVHRESIARSHPGEEFVYVLAGTLRLTVGTHVFDLKTGESMCFHSGEPHRYAPVGKRTARILSIRVDG
jgi:quercetin dioxygenase-like cupin family protein/DNA-binding XRE family transcriptional regulator